MLGVATTSWEQRPTRLAWLQAAIACGWAIALGVGDVESVLLYLAPALLILVPLALNRYPGERALLRAAARLWPQRRPREQRRTPLPRPVAARPLHGGLLVGMSLAGRAPPPLISPVG
jgi:hypothetical protein